jgi:hypothetical protein
LILFLYRVRDGDLALVFYVWISSFSSSICWRGYLSSNIHLWHLCWESNGCSSVGLLLDLLFCSIGLSVFFCASTMLLLLLRLCSIVWSQILWYSQHSPFCSGLLWLFRVFCASMWILGLLFYSVKNIFGILLGITLTVGLLVIWPFSHY